MTLPWIVLRRDGDERPGRGTLLAATDAPTDLLELVCGIERVAVLRALTTASVAPLARVGRPDLILAGARLADGPSLPALRALRAGAETRGIPVFGICDPDDEEARRAMRAAGCRGFLPTAFRAGEFLDLLRAWMPRPSVVDRS